MQMYFDKMTMYRDVRFLRGQRNFFTNTQFLLHSVYLYLIKVKPLIRNSLVFKKSRTLLEGKQIDKVVTE